MMRLFGVEIGNLIIKINQSDIEEGNDDTSNYALVDVHSMMIYESE